MARLLFIPSINAKARQSRPPNSNIKLILFFLWLYFRLTLPKTATGFHYSDFANASGLILNGDAFVATTCIDDARDSPPLYYQGEEGSHQLSSSFELATAYDKQNNRSDMEKTTATFGHRYDSASSVHDLEDHCKKRLRLTPSHPSNVGSVWYEKKMPVLDGFETKFRFQISDHSQICSFHVDPAYGISHYKSCAIHGGDGFAFVLHLDQKLNSSAVGGNGFRLGYSGIANSIAVEFDTWTNADNNDESDDVFFDHISIHSAGKNPNKSDRSSSLGYWRAISLADGKIHTVCIRYLPRIETAYLEAMTANDNLLPYIKDNGEGRSVGTLAVFIDEGVESDTPILAITLNLSVLLDLPQDDAYVGFTASTGLKWEKHDILDWQWCSTELCTQKQTA